MHLPWRVRLFGGLAVQVGERTITRFQTQKTGALLARLALHPGRVHLREELAELLWPEGDPIAVRNRLNQAISSLRRQLHPPEIQAGMVLVADHRTLSLNPESVSTDYNDFHEALKRAKAHEGEPEEFGALWDALGCYTGELLHGYWEDWVLPERVFASDQYFAAATRLVRILVMRGDFEGAIVVAQRRLEIDPTDERHHRSLMSLYTRAGRPKSALMQFEEMERVLASFGEVPSKRALELKKLAQEMRQAPAQARPAQVGPRPLSNGKEAPESPPLLGASPTLAPSLPRPLNRFVGRQEELEHIRNLLASSDVRLVTLAGMGGAGKTRLAVEAAWKLTEVFGPNIVFAGMQDLSRPDEIATVLARTLVGLEPNGEQGLEALSGWFSSRSETLLVLDEFDRTAGEGLGSLTEILHKIPNMRVLATCRQPLSLEGEHVVWVQPLGVPSMGSFSELSELIRVPSVELFVNRAQAVRQDFQLTERTAEPIRALCTKLEGIPLAIELAAAWMRSMTPGQMLDQVEKSMDLLESRRKDIAAKHRSMRAVFDSSFALLNQEQKDCMLRMSVFQGTWSAASGARLCPGMDVESILEELTSRSLVASTVWEDSKRYSMLGTVRQFCKTQMSPDLLEECRWLYAQAMSERLLDLRDLPSSRVNVAIQQDYSDYVGAMAVFCEKSELGAALQMAVLLSPFWQTTGRSAEGLQWVAKFTECPCLAQDPAFAEAVFWKGIFEWELGQYAESEVSLQRSHQILDSLEVRHKSLGLRLAFAVEHHRKGHYELAHDLLVEILEDAHSSGAREIEVRTLNRLGHTAVERKEFAAAESYYLDALRAARSYDIKEREMSTLVNLGNLAVLTGNFRSGREWLGEAVTYLEEAGLTQYLVDACLILSQLERTAGEPKQALGVVGKVLELNPKEFRFECQALEEVAYSNLILGNVYDSAKLLGFVEHYRAERRGTRSVVEEEIFQEHVALGRRLSEEMLLEGWRVGSLFTAEQARHLAAQMLSAP